MELVPVSGLGLKVGDRLEFPIFDRAGLVLLQKGKVIPDDVVLQRLVERGFFELRRAASEPLHSVEVSEAALERESSAAGRLALLVEMVDRIFRNLVQVRTVQMSGGR